MQRAYDVAPNRRLVARLTLARVVYPVKEKNASVFLSCWDGAGVRGIQQPMLFDCLRCAPVIPLGRCELSCI
jgi:hypothetical protein